VRGLPNTAACVREPTCSGIGRDSTRVDRTSADPIRSAAARQAVLLRSEGRCENPGCTSDIQDLTDSGDPILEIDHIHDLALGGPDDPAQMIALCPNCHAIESRGQTRESYGRYC
jgi:5-methylcytosine-specific restriction enzyme A